ncbi:MAG: phospholipase D-like domain-containing protein [Chloroflexi bacterium]|nr:phospholipase D-like domain-containing protein [Chloroflexota bacterium]MCI0580776.1 phospholipase D-like domain-containing protein [Chloroflexota bacterium]MCI0648701.1 phospholipase D-like domain-containing protein [Chloroflexota bacterium]MCI0731502.1 phospholipase D-like domain-containing protein [Chloroflexota bacterium]
MMNEVELSVHGSKSWATYPPREGNWVKFYNDASVDEKGSEGAFKDIERAIHEAEQFIFICDWSFHPQLAITRSADPEKDWIFTLGETLVGRAENNDGLLIAIHAWKHAGDDDTSDAALGFLAEKGNNGKPANLLWRATHRTGFLWSHHQKYVILDAPADGGKERQVKVFFGGLDLTRGRFDWPGHPIAGDDANRYVKAFDDWYNGEFNHDESLPREPWHDIHAQLTGPAVWDFLYEFVGRWNSGRGGSSFGIVGDEDKAGRVWRKFVELHDHDDIYGPEETPATGPWTASVYRSIENVAWTPPDKKLIQVSDGDIGERFQWRLRASYEKSIQQAYSEAIQHADRYIYIETQYLIGSPVTHGSVVKNENQNLIPGAIVERIAARHAAGEPFHVYIVLPMFPEGDPISAKTQPVRYWQGLTIAWMVSQVQQALGGGNWQDYLSFYFLGQRSGNAGYDPSAVTDRQARVQRSNRYMIYVHSKMMIVDDNWIIIGSANLNERSMAGDRDTEICVGMSPTSGHNNAADCVEQIREFRMRLWAEHLGQNFARQNKKALEQHPEASATAALVQAEALRNLQLFYQDTADASMGHLMLWGEHSGLTGGAYDYIPDYGGSWQKYWTWRQTEHTTGGGDIRFL